MAVSGGTGWRAVGVTPFETRVDAILDVAQLADRCGFDGFGVAESMGHSAPLLLAEVAASTTRIELSTTVLSIWSRSPAVLAMDAIGLQRLSGGRFVLGLGASTPPLTEGLHGMVWSDPIGRLRSVLQAVRGLLDGQRLPEPAPGSRALRLAVEPEHPVPLALGSLSPATVRLAGELADRWLPFLWPRSQLAAGRQLLEEGAERAGRDEVAQICPSVPLAVGPDQRSAEGAAARWLTVYCTQMGPIYPRMLRERFGYATEVDALLAANAGGGPPVLPPRSRRLADDVLLMAPYDAVADALEVWADAGAQRIALTLPLGAATAELEAAVLAAAPMEPPE